MFKTKSEWKSKTAKELIDDLWKGIDIARETKPLLKKVMIISKTAENEKSFMESAKENRWVKCEDGVYRSYFTKNTIQVVPDHYMPLDSTGHPRKSFITTR